MQHLLHGRGAFGYQQDAANDDEDSQPAQRRHGFAEKEAGDQRYQHEVQRQEGIRHAQVQPRQHGDPGQRANGVKDQPQDHQWRVQDQADDGKDAGGRLSYARLADAQLDGCLARHAGRDREQDEGDG